MSTDSGQYQSIDSCRTSFGRSRRTGPGAAGLRDVEGLTDEAGMSCALITSSLCFVTVRVMPTVSHSWNASVPMAGRETWPVMQTIGIESMKASHSGVTMFVAAGPLVTMATPARPVTWA